MLEVFRGVLSRSASAGSEDDVVEYVRAFDVTSYHGWRRLERARRRRRGRADFVTAAGRSAVWYHTPRALLEAAPGFTRHALYGVGAFLPPSELFGACERFPRLSSMLAALDRRSARFTHGLSDHYLLILRRR
jgi:hypothetical protein